MAEVRSEARDQLLGYLVNERQSQQETREWVQTWLAAHCPREALHEPTVVVAYSDFLATKRNELPYTAFRAGWVAALKNEDG